MKDITEVPNFLVDIEQLKKETLFFLKNKKIWSKDNQLCFLNTKNHKPDLLQGVGNVFCYG